MVVEGRVSGRRKGGEERGRENNLAPKHKILEPPLSSTFLAIT